MWDMRGKIMLQAMQSGDKPVKIIIKERGKEEASHDNGNYDKTERREAKKDRPL